MRQRYGKQSKSMIQSCCDPLLGVETGEPVSEVTGELLSGDGYQLDYEDGYPKLPACLDRRASKP